MSRCPTCGTHVFEPGEPAEPDDEVARLRAEIKQLKADDPTWFAYLDRVTMQRDALLAAAKRITAPVVRFCLVLPITVEEIDALRAAVEKCEEKP